MPTEPDDLDGCEVDFTDPAHVTPDADVDALVLFADVDWTDPEAVAKREAEWREVLA